MKKILFSLMIFAVYASANTCTEAWFYIRNPVFLLIPQNAPYIDSAYFKEGTEVTFFKASYRDGHIDKTYQGLIWENYGSGITDIDQYYVSRDESVLSKKILKFYFLIRHLETQLIWKECVIITEKLVKKFFIKQPTPTHQVLVQKTPIGKVLMAQWKVFHGKNSPNFSLEMTL